MNTALVLSGGGAGGAFQVGVLAKIWEEEKKNISAIYGTSVGSLNGAALKHLDIQGLTKIWLGIRGKKDVLTRNMGSFLGLSKGVYGTGPLQKIVSNVLDQPAAYPKLNVWVSVVSLESGDVSYIHHSDNRFKDMVMASASVPFHMEPVGDYVDGGVRDHTPVSRALDDGYKRVIVICCNPIGRKQRDVGYKPKWPYLVDIGLRCTDILQAEVLYGDLLACKNSDVEIYAPDKRIIETFDYDPVKIRAAIDQGYNTLIKSIEDFRI